MSNMYDWEICDHEGIGEVGCPTCDPDKGRVMIRLQRLDNRDLRAKLAAAEAESSKAIAWLDRCAWARSVIDLDAGPLEVQLAEARAQLASLTAALAVAHARIGDVLVRLDDESMEAEDYSPVDDLRAALSGAPSAALEAYGMRVAEAVRDAIVNPSLGEWVKSHGNPHTTARELDLSALVKSVKP